MTLSLQGKYALVTGSTDGLGKKTAFELARQGAHVIIHGRNAEKVAATQDEIQRAVPGVACETIVCDLEDGKAVQSVFSQIKKLDVLINNAGTWYTGNTIDMTTDRVVSMVNVNMLGPLLITRIMLPILLQSDFGQIINIVSKDGTEVPSGYFDTVYVATKFAIRGFTEGLAKEFYNKNLRVMGYYPGGMETNIFKKAGDSVKQHEPWMFDPQESAEALVFMLTRNKKVNLKRMDLINHLEQ